MSREKLVYPHLNLMNWPRLTSLQFNVVLAHVVQNKVKDKINAFFVLETDVVLVIGRNISGLLGLGSWPEDLEVEHPVEIAKLRGKGIVKFSSGSEHILALSVGGIVYGWGLNSESQICPYYEVSIVDIPQDINAILGLKKAYDIECGSSRSFVCFYSEASKDELFWIGFGDNTAGHISPNQTLTSHLINMKINPTGKKTVKVVDIKCGSYTVALIEECGKTSCIYWGGSASTNEARYSLVCSNVVKIGAGLKFIAALKKNGHILWVSCNSLGSWTSEEVQIDRFDNIFSVWNSPLLVAASRGYIYSWTSPDKFSRISGSSKEALELFAPFNFPSCFKLNVHCLGNPRSLEILFNQRETSDIKFLLSGNETVYAHRAILVNFCPHFHTMLNSVWSEQNEIDMTSYSSNVYKNFIRYVYTNSVEDLTLLEYVELWHIANSYFEIKLKEYTEDRIIKDLSIVNILSVLPVILSTQSKRLEELSLKFITENYSAIVAAAESSESSFTILPYLFKHLEDPGALENQDSP